MLTASSSVHHTCKHSSPHITNLTTHAHTPRTTYHTHLHIWHTCRIRFLTFSLSVSVTKLNARLSTFVSVSLHLMRLHTHILTHLIHYLTLVYDRLIGTLKSAPKWFHALALPRFGLNTPKKVACRYETILEPVPVCQHRRV